jgi:molybdopterin converting factor small subunit
MEVTVLFHSYFRELTGCPEAIEEIPGNSRLADLIARLHQRFPRLQPMQRSTLIAVGVEYQDANYVLQDGDEVSLFPPVQGG